MALIQPIESRTIHQIQSGQVIVDLCSVVKELVENSLDAHATSIDIRFKNYGVDSIEVQDNGEGVRPENFKTIALKHYTSKLSTYEDLSSLQTFGFRGEALSSLCALSSFHIVTARAEDGPKGTRLDFESSGRLSGTSIVASPKGTTIFVDTIFKDLPVRRRELERNAKREYNKAVNLLNAYACISTGVRFTVSNALGKGRKSMVFSTNSNVTTRENIANVFGAKTLAALIALNLEFEMRQSIVSGRKYGDSQHISIIGHISRPILGEGRQTPDRQMFFVNSRPCGLPQIAKAFNEVYKAFNMSQSPFIFADIKMNTSAYDVNVSPDKRTILLHDQNQLLENIKVSLTDLFEDQIQTVPHASTMTQRLPSFRQLAISQLPSNPRPATSSTVSYPPPSQAEQTELEGHGHRPEEEEIPTSELNPDRDPIRLSDDENVENEMQEDLGPTTNPPCSDVEFPEKNASRAYRRGQSAPSSQFDPSLEGEVGLDVYEQKIQKVDAVTAIQGAGVVQNAFNRIRPRRVQAETATITIGPKTIVSMIGSPAAKRQRTGDSSYPTYSSNSHLKSQRFDRIKQFAEGISSFVAPGSLENPDSSEESPGRADNHSQPSPSSPISSVNDGHRDSQEAFDSVSTSELVESANEVGRDDSSAESDGYRSDNDSDEDYLNNEGERRRREEARVNKLIEEAEKVASSHDHDVNKRRAAFGRAVGKRKDSVLNLNLDLPISLARLSRIRGSLDTARRLSKPAQVSALSPSVESPEQQLSLIISKSDFSAMSVVGQFNLGFILATRSSASPALSTQLQELLFPTDLFIIDQHASDEKYNFERLQRTTSVQNQRLVQPRALELTAIEEEIIAEHQAALSANGFQITLDDSGNLPVGRRCHLLALPASKEVVFDTSDLEELLALLAEAPLPSSIVSPQTLTQSARPLSPDPVSTAATTRESDQQYSFIPRPSKVRRLFAMRACRSSIMIGRHLTSLQMERVIRHMGEIEKPWNCPHGRPTMRHLFGLGSWKSWDEETQWVQAEAEECDTGNIEEAEGLTEGADARRGPIDWENYMRHQR